MITVVNAVAAKMGGAGNYVRSLVQELARRQDAGRFVFYVPPEQASVATNLPAHVEWRVTGVGHGSLVRRILWDQIGLRRTLRLLRADVLYCPANFGMLYSPVPQLLQVNDARYFSDLFRAVCLPQYGPASRLVYRLRRRLVLLSIAAADCVTTPSRSLRDALIEGGGVDPGKAMANPYGLALPEAIRVAKRDAGSRYELLYPVLYSDHKDLGTLLEAIRLLAEKAPGRFHLTTTADPTWEMAGRPGNVWRKDAELLSQAPIRAATTVVGPVSRQRMAELYAGADIVVYPTLVESFGHPLLEALAWGLPVVASDIPTNRELARDAALYFRPQDPAELAARVEQLAQDPALRRALAERGPRYARQYSWAKHTDFLVARLRELAAKKRGVQ